jgi:hypothetical protein
MLKDNAASQQEEILRVFEEFQELSKTIYPDLLTDISSFNENHVVLESYENYINTLNSPPSLTSSNRVCL